MISLDLFLQCVQENAARVQEYESGHDGSDGKCDCIGLIIGALKLAGFKWPGVHGSNWAARNAMETLEHITDVHEIFIGEIVYKAKDPEDVGYSLPKRYYGSGDLRDYYHVGVVTGVNPLQITHCTSVPGGIKRDNALGKWKYGGKLKYIDYSEEFDMNKEALYQAVIVASNGCPVNVRSGPGKSYAAIDKLDVGTAVDVLEESYVWNKIRYGATEGYMMREFLKKEAETETDAELHDILEHFETAVSELKAYMEVHA